MIPWLVLALSAAAPPPAPSTSPSGPAPGAAVESSEGPGEDVTLARALEILRDASPRVRADRSAVAEAQAEVEAARAAPDPSLDYAGSRLRSGTNTGAAETDQLALTWPVLAFGQRGARVRAAESGVLASEARVDAELAARTLDVRVAFEDLLVQQERVSVLEDARSDLDRVAAIVSGRHDAGDASSYDLLRVETEAREADAALGDARGDLADAAGRLASLLGRPGARLRAVGTAAPAVIEPLDPAALWPLVEARLSVLAAAREEESAARSQEKAALRGRWPVPVLTGGIEKTRDASSTSAVFGVSIPIPALDRNRGDIARARAREESAALERKALEAETRADLERAVAVVRERRAALAEFEAGVEARLPQMREMAEAAYREGRGGILDLLDALRSMTSTRLARLDAVQSAARADADLLYLVGRADDPSP